MKFYQLIILLFFVSLNASFSQERLKDRFEFIEVGLFIHSISWPYESSNGFAKLNRLPGLRIGTSLPINERQVGFSYRPSISFYHQKDLHYGWHFNHQMAMTFPSKEKINVELLPAIGYLHTFEDAPIYNTRKNKVRHKRDWGSSQLTISLGLGMQWKMAQRSAVFIHHQFLLQLPFARKGGVFFIPHNRLHLGFRRYLLNN